MIHPVQLLLQFVGRDVFALGVLRVHLQVRLVVLKTKCKSLTYLLGLVVVLHKDLPFTRKSIKCETGFLPYKFGLGGLRALVQGLGRLVLRFNN